MSSPSKSSFTKVAIANRGEVAVRIIRACEELGLKTVLLHSEVDKGTRAYRMADETVCIGPAPSSESYLHIERNIQGALSKGAQALHPGFGFLSENMNFALACANAGIKFIGPSPVSIQKMGDKISASQIVQELGFPVIPGYHGYDQTNENLKNHALKIGFPLIIKAAAGGGGRGMKVVHSMNEFEEQLSSARRESKAAFGSDVVFLEKYIRSAKHIEFQVFGDSFGNVVHLGERECSVQRRHQKIIEEAPSFLLTEELRKKMGAAAVAAARAADYEGAGTVEFLLDGEQFYFLEMNTRLQVEHPVTEMVYGVDLVKAQILVAQGLPVPWTQDQLRIRGHAIECRLYAEDPYNAGLPSIGVLGYQSYPEGPGRRFEFGFEAGDEVTSYYDPMISKIIVWDESRRLALKKMLTVLSQTVIFGVKTNIPFLREIIEHPEFKSGTMDTQFISRYFAEGLKNLKLSSIENEFLKKANLTLSGAKTSSHVEANSFHPSPWQASMWGSS